MRLLVAHCSVEYNGRGSTVLPEAVRLIMLKRDGSVSIHSDDRAYKPLNWMLPPCQIDIADRTGRRGRRTPQQVWTVRSAREQLTINIFEILSDTNHTLAEADPGLSRAWTEPHIQAWLASHVEESFGPGWALVSREYQTGAGPVDLLVTDPAGTWVAVEVKRVATMNAVDQVCRYVAALDADPACPAVRGLLAAITVKPRARALADDREVEWMEFPPGVFRADQR